MDYKKFMILFQKYSIYKRKNFIADVIAILAKSLIKIFIFNSIVRTKMFIQVVLSVMSKLKIDCMAYFRTKSSYMAEYLLNS